MSNLIILLLLLTATFGISNSHQTLSPEEIGIKEHVKGICNMKLGTTIKLGLRMVYGNDNLQNKIKEADDILKKSKQLVELVLRNLDTSRQYLQAILDQVNLDAMDDGELDNRKNKNNVAFDDLLRNAYFMYYPPKTAHQNEI